MFPIMMRSFAYGICMGLRALPICGICPVRKGSTSARAKNIAARIIL